MINESLIQACAVDGQRNKKAPRVVGHVHLTGHVEKEKNRREIPQRRLRERKKKLEFSSVIVAH